MTMTEIHVGEFTDLLKVRAAMAREEEELVAEKEARTKDLKDQISVLRVKLEEASKPFAEHEEHLYSAIENLTQQMRDQWGDNAKTQYVDGFIVRRRDLKRMEVLDKDLLVDELGKLGKLTVCIKKFDDKMLIKLREVDVLGDKGAVIMVKSSISCTKDKEAKAVVEAPVESPVSEHVRIMREQEEAAQRRPQKAPVPAQDGPTPLLSREEKASLDGLR